MRSIAVALAVLAAMVPATSATWAIKKPNIAAVAASVSFTSDKNGFIPGGDNGVGAEILRTSNGGSTWRRAQGVTGLMYLGGAAYGDSVVASGLFSLEFSNNAGANFSSSGQSGDYIAASQSAAAADSTFFGIAGQSVGNGNGVSTSSNGGANFTFTNVTALLTEARYIALPSRTSWYVSAGQWPNNAARTLEFEKATGSKVLKMLTSRLAVTAEPELDAAGVKTGGVRHRVQALPRVGASGLLSDDAGPGEWAAEIVKTSDGGKTFQSSFWNQGEFYFNDIDCGDENNCCAIGESDSAPEPGVRIYCTNDGGQTWTRTLFVPGADMSGMALDYVLGSPLDVWAGGGQLSETAFEGYFWHSVDGGKTWTNETLAGVYVNDITFPDATHGYATAFTEQDGTSLLAYTA